MAPGFVILLSWITPVDPHLSTCGVLNFRLRKLACTDPRMLLPKSSASTQLVVLLEVERPSLPRAVSLGAPAGRGLTRSTGPPRHAGERIQGHVWKRSSSGLVRPGRIGTTEVSVLVPGVPLPVLGQSRRPTRSRPRWRVP